MTEELALILITYSHKEEALGLNQKPFSFTKMLLFSSNTYNRRAA